MTDQVQDAPVVEATQDTAATPEEQIVETPQETTDAQADEAKVQADVKTFTQDQLDEIIKKEKAKAEARAERRAAKAYSEKLEEVVQRNQKPQERVQEAKADGKPQLSKFENVEDYVEAVADWKMQQRDAAVQRQQLEQHQKVLLTKTEKIYAEAEKDPEFDRETFEDAAQYMTPVIAETIIDSDVSGKLMAYLSKNPNEIERIASLSPARQAAEIGKLETKVSAAKKVETSKAPAPVKPIGSRGGAVSANPADMPQKDFEKWLYGKK